VTVLIVTCLVALAVIVVVQGLVLLEMVRQTAQIRRALDLDDRPVPISLGELAGRPLPEPAHAAWPANHDGVILLLSTDCTTCRLVASGLRELIDRFQDQRILTILQARVSDEANEMVAAAGLAHDEVVVDLDRRYGEAFGIAMRPAAVVVRGGLASEGAVVRNARQLQQLFEAIGPSTEVGLRELPPVSAMTTGGAT
jgi:hypothetical protein